MQNLPVNLQSNIFNEINPYNPDKLTYAISSNIFVHMYSDKTSKFGYLQTDNSTELVTHLHSSKIKTYKKCFHNMSGRYGLHKRLLLEGAIDKKCLQHQDSE